MTPYRLFPIRMAQSPQRLSDQGKSCPPCQRWIDPSARALSIEMIESNTPSMVQMAGRATQAGLFDGRKQLIVYHLFSPENEASCEECSGGAVNHPSSLSYLRAHETTLVLVSCAPLTKIEKLKSRTGCLPLVSIFWHRFQLRLPHY